MIVVVIISIVAAFAVPAYQEQVLRGKRAEGKAFLLDLASRQERYYTQFSSYSPQVASADSCSGANCYLGIEEAASPQKHYTVDAADEVGEEPDGCSASGPLCTGYTLEASAKADDPKCKTLTYTHAGGRGVVDSGGTVYAEGSDRVDYCWR